MSCEYHQKKYSGSVYLNRYEEFLGNNIFKKSTFRWKTAPNNLPLKELVEIALKNPQRISKVNEKEEEILIDSQVKASPVLIVRKRLFSNKINRQKVEKVD